MLYCNIVITLILLSTTIICVLCYTDHIVQENRWSLIDQRANSDSYRPVFSLRIRQDIMTTVIPSVK